jgi:hypothetical protein
LEASSEPATLHSAWLIFVALFFGIVVVWANAAPRLPALLSLRDWPRSHFRTLFRLDGSPVANIQQARIDPVP